MSSDILTLWPQEEDVVPMTSSERISRSAPNGDWTPGRYALPPRLARPARITAADFASEKPQRSRALLELAAAIAFGFTGPLNRRS